ARRPRTRVRRCQQEDGGGQFSSLSSCQSATLRYPGWPDTAILLGLRGYPRSDGLVLRPECCDLFTITVRQVDIVPTVQQLVAADRINHERTVPGTTADCLPLQINIDRLCGIGGDCCRELGNLCLRNNRRQQSVFYRVLRENISER